MGENIKIAILLKWPLKLQGKLLSENDQTYWSVSWEIKQISHLLAVDKNTDKAHFFILIRGINTKFKITEEIVRMCSITSYTTRKAICNVIKCLPAL